MEARISVRTSLLVASFQPANKLTWANTSFKEGVLSNKSKARRLLLQADTLIEAFKSITVTQKRMEQCCQASRLIIMIADLDGRAWQFRADNDSDSICPHDFSAAVPSDTGLAHWYLLMIEVNWDMHLASVRHIWKDNRRIVECIAKLHEAINRISIIHKQHRLLPQHILAVAAAKLVVIWLAPQWT
jgi:hypothetical protein